ncbi:MAG TPA: winged helix-turn-helix domain-containing protein [Pyrinomonadaceae bacterium]
MRPTKSIIYSFDTFTMDVLERRLWRGDALVALTPKAFDTLLVLLENKGRIVDKDVLLDEVWKDTFVEEATLAQNVSTIRKALGTLPDGTQFIETVPRRGYRFLREVSEASSDEETIVIQRHRSTMIAAEQTTFNDAKSEAVTDVEPRRQARNGWLARHRTLVMTFAAVAIVTAVGGWFLARPYLRSRTLAASSFLHTQVTKLTSDGNIQLVRVSPNGNFVAMAVRRGDLSALEVRQIDSSSTVEVVAPKKRQFVGITFSPDERQIYFVAYDAGGPDTAGRIGKLYRVPTMSGQIEELTNDIDSPVAFAPDGHRFAFVRNYPSEKESDIMLADLKEAGERKFASRPIGQYFAPSGPAWSPDAKTIAVPAKTSSGETAILGIDAASGQQREMTNAKLRWAANPNWLADSSGLVISAFSDASGDRSDEIWEISAADGSTRKIAGGTSGILGLSLTADSRSITAVESKLVSSVWLSPTGAVKDAAQIKQNLPELNIDPTGMSFTPDGKILYGSSLNGNVDIWMMGADGGNGRQITTGDGADSMPVIIEDGHAIAFVSNRSGRPEIWRMNLDGTEQTQLTNVNGAGSPSVAGRDIYFSAIDEKSQNVALYKLSVDGGTPTQITSSLTLLPQVSPDGKWIACYSPPTVPDAQGSNRLALTILAAETGKVVKQWNADLSGNLSPIVWSDAQHFNYVTYDGAVSHLTRQGLNDPAPSAILDLPNERIFKFAWSPSGAFAYERGTALNNVVLIRSETE